MGSGQIIEKGIGSTLFRREGIEESTDLPL